MCNQKNDYLNLSLDNKQLIPRVLERLHVLRAQDAIVQAQPIGMMRIALGNQLNATSGLFLHIWFPGLPMQATGGPFAHTHVFHLKSKVLKGEVRNVVYSPVSNPNGTHKLVQALCEQDYCSLEQKVIFDRVNMEIVDIQDIHTGETYEVPKDVFHETIIKNNDTVMTIMEKSCIENCSPIAAIPYNLPISAELFDRNQLDQDIAWKQIIALLEEL